MLFHFSSARLFAGCFLAAPKRRKSLRTLRENLESLESRIVLSSTTGVDDAATEDAGATEDIDSVFDSGSSGFVGPVAEDPGMDPCEDPGEDPATESTDFWIGSISVTDDGEVLTIFGTVVAGDAGSVEGFTVNFYGVLAGETATTDANGDFVLIVSNTISGAASADASNSLGDVSDEYFFTI